MEDLIKNALFQYFKANNVFAKIDKVEQNKKSNKHFNVFLSNMNLGAIENLQGLLAISPPSISMTLRYFHNNELIFGI